jgi:hypothetical protein
LPAKYKKIKQMKDLFLASVALLAITFTSSCGKKLEACASFNETAYHVNDTIFVNASCSANADTYLWEPQAGLQMLGSGNAVTERFIVLPLSGSLSRTIYLTLTNSQSMRKISKSVVVL